MTQGRVEHASCFENDGLWLTDISYSYSVANEFYSGQFQIRVRGEQKANDNVARWKAQNIGVRYRPTDPEVSVVRFEDQSGFHPGEFQGH
jgi:hypothetical protein